MILLFLVLLQKNEYTQGVLTLKKIVRLKSTHSTFQRPHLYSTMVVKVRTNICPSPLQFLLHIGGLCCRPFLKEHSLYKVGKVAGKQSTIMRGL
jgi:hypothetical protein